MVQRYLDRKAGFTAVSPNDTESGYYKELVKQVRAISPSPDPVEPTKAGLVKYFQYEYGTQKQGRTLAWKQHLVETILAEKNITRDNTDPKEYRRQYSHVSRRFEGERINKPEEKSNLSTYKTIADSLPAQSAKAPPNGFKVSGSGWLKISETEAHFSFDNKLIQGQAAQELAQNPNFDTYFLAYFTNHTENPVESFSLNSFSVEPA